MKETKIREYYITEKVIKKALKLEGDIQGMELWEGLTPTQEDEGKSHSGIKWAITTKEIMEDSEEEEHEKGI